MRNRLLKTWEFSSRTRKTLTFSSNKIRLNDDVKTDQGLTLSKPYDLALTHTVTTPAIAPKALKQWLMFEANEEKPDGTSIGYRLLRGADELYWDGAAWVAASTDAHWNSMNQINTNIQALVLTGFDLKIKVNLRTTDQKATPKVRWIKVLALVDFDAWDDLIYDTVVRSMKTTLRATTVIQAEVAASSSTLNLATDYRVENSGYNFTAVRAAYNLTDDPNCFVNLAQSYTPGAAKEDGTAEPGTVTLSSPIASGKIIRLEMEHAPEVAVYTSQDYYEVARLPAIVFENIAAVRVGGRHDQELNDAEGDVIRDLEEGVGVEVLRPRQSTIRFDFAIHASPLDLAKMIDAVDAWMAANRILRSWGFDETLNLDPINEADTKDKTNIEDVVMSTGAFQLRGVSFYARASRDVNLVLNVNLNMNP